MKRLVLPCLLVLGLVLPAAALALPQTTGDGTLAVRGASGDPGTAVVTLTVAGAIVGHIDGGRLVVDDFNGASTFAPVVTGADKPAHDLPSGATAYVGTDVSFRAIGGHYRIRIFGHGISVNVVGQGTVRLQGSSSILLADGDGRYSVNGETWRSLPTLGDVFTLGG
jgi:hypothetical protein